jgi:hypothetical protein
LTIRARARPEKFSAPVARSRRATAASRSPLHGPHLAGALPALALATVTRTGGRTQRVAGRDLYGYADLFFWEEITTKYKLKRVPYMDLVAWPCADYVFSADWDVMSDVTKSRLYGFQDVVDSEAMFVLLLGRFREERIVP